MKGKSVSIRRALSLRFLQAGITFVFTAASVTIVSRLLTPAEIGVFSVAMAFVALVHMLRDFGVSEFVVQEKALSDDLVRSAFTINLIIAWTLAAVLFAASNLIGDFYRDPGVGRVTRVISLVFVLLPFGTTTMACMKREMQFGAVVAIHVIETVVRSSLTIALAYAGFSYMSMAWSSVAGMGVLVLGCTLLGGRYRVRGLGFTEWKRVLHFGSYRTATDLCTQIGNRSADIVIGRMLGMAAAGYYSRGYGIVNMFRNNVAGTIGSVAFPAFAREHRDSNTAPELFRTSLVYLTGISWPFFAFATLMAFPIMRIAFGDQWDAAVPLMRWLCVAAIVGTLVFQTNAFLTAVGRYRAVTRIEIEFQLARVAIVVLAAFYGLEAVAASQIAAYALATVLYYHKLREYPPLHLRELAVALIPSVLLTIVSCLASVVVLVWWRGDYADHYVLAFLLAAAGAVIGWLTGVFVFRHPLSREVRRGWFLLRARMPFVPAAH